MGAALFPSVEEWKKSPGGIEDVPLITTLGLIEGEVLISWRTTERRRCVDSPGS